ncbi:MAG: hypothetical protein ACOC2W_04315, partial [bacterium]
FDIILDADLSKITSLNFNSSDSNLRKIFLINLIELFRNLPNLEFIELSNNADINKDTSNIIFPKNINTFLVPDSNIEGNIDTWLNIDNLENININLNPLYGRISTLINSNIKVLKARFRINTLTPVDLSGVILPNTIEELELGSLINSNLNTYFISDISNWNFNNSNLKILKLINFDNIQGDMNNINIPNSIEEIEIYRIGKCDLIYNISSLNINSKSNLKTLNLDFLSGDISNIILPTNLEFLKLDFSEISGSFETVTIPNKLNYLSLNDIDNINFSFDLTGYDSKNLVSIYANDSNLTGDPQNILSNSNLNDIFLNYNNLTGVIDYSLNQNNIELSNNNLTFDFNNMSTNNNNSLRLNNNNSIGLFQNCSFIGVKILNLSNMGISGNFVFSNFSDLIQLSINNNNISGDLTNITSSNIFSSNLKNLDLSNNNFTGDITNWNISNFRWVIIGENNFIGDVSNWVLNSEWEIINFNNLSNITGLNNLIFHLFDNRTIYTNFFRRTFNFTNIDEISNNPTQWVIEQGDFGTYTGNLNQISESEINNLKDGNDFDNTGTNTPWTPGHCIWWIKNAKKQTDINTNRFFELITIY